MSIQSETTKRATRIFFVRRAASQVRRTIKQYCSIEWRINNDRYSVYQMHVRSENKVTIPKYSDAV